MKVIVDPEIQKDPYVLETVEDANRYLDDLLDTISDTVAAEWSIAGGRGSDVVLTLNSLDDIPATVTTVISTKQLADADVRPSRVGAALRRFLHDRGRIRARRVDQMLAELPD